MLLAASLAILKTVFRLRRRSRNAGGLLQDGPIFLFFLGSPSNRSSGSLFSSLFLHFTVLGLHFDPQLGPLGLTFSRFFRVWTPLGPYWPPLGPPAPLWTSFSTVWSSFRYILGTIFDTFSRRFGWWVGWLVGWLVGGLVG